VAAIDIGAPGENLLNLHGVDDAELFLRIGIRLATETNNYVAANRVLPDSWLADC
jgi:hypothetical protein